MDIIIIVKVLGISLVAISAISGLLILCEKLKRSSNYKKYGEAEGYPSVMVRRFEGKAESIPARQLTEGTDAVTLYFANDVESVKRGTIIKGVPKTELIR